MIMSTRLAVLLAPPSGLAETEGAARLRQARVICVVAAARVQDFASQGPGADTSATTAEAGPR
jgi:hypothetical protein